ncbi:MAG TPA: hypothetical protein PLI87_21235, partial [bacterium]|nr:hypothetical protein [bacterium]
MFIFSPLIALDLIIQGCCILTRKCRLDTSVPLNEANYPTTGFSVKPHHCHDLQVVGQIKQ